MEFKINADIGKMTGFNGPSQSYYDTQQRFNEILSSKLNIKIPDIEADTEGILESRTGSEKRSSNTALASYLAQSLSNQASGGMMSSATSNSVINTNNVTQKSTMTAAEIESKLMGTPLQGLGSSFKQAEEKYGVNALFLLGLAIHESDFGKSKIAKDKNNLFGFKAYDRSPYSSAQGFASFAGGIDTVAKYLSENYLSTGGKYFNGFSIGDIGKRYATDPQWANGIISRIRSLLGF